MTNKNIQADYAKYISAAGDAVIVCGRMRQMLELLIADRALGKGTRKGGSQIRNWNMAEAARQLAVQGVLIAKRIMRFRDPNTTTGRGSVCDYFLLEPWARVSDIFRDREGAEMASVSRTQWPASQEPVQPFIDSGSLKRISDLKLLKPASLLPSAAAVQAMRGSEIVTLAGEGA